MKKFLNLFLKGIAIGIANIIPGVSGGTIALITEVYEDLINSIKSFDIKALKLLRSYKFYELLEHINAKFLFPILFGLVFSAIFSAKLLSNLFEKENDSLIWSLFFGLILSSVYFIGKRVKNWNQNNIIILIFGFIISISLLFLTPASENDNLFFVFLCGLIGIIGMMVPGLSGSFIIILMGNYALMLNFLEKSFMLQKDALILLSVFILGNIIGLLSFSRLIAWLLKNYKDQLLSLLTGFILGSLMVIWPWQECQKWLDIEKKEKCLEIIRYLPNLNIELLYHALLMLIGFLIVWWLEVSNLKKTN